MCSTSISVDKDLYKATVKRENDDLSKLVQVENSHLVDNQSIRCPVISQAMESNTIPVVPPMKQEIVSDFNSELNTNGNDMDADVVETKQNKVLDSIQYLHRKDSSVNDVENNDVLTVKLEPTDSDVHSDDNSNEPTSVKQELGDDSIEEFGGADENQTGTFANTGKTEQAKLNGHLIYKNGIVCVST